MTNGTDPAFYHPQFAQHWEEAFSVYNLEVEVGKQIMTGEKLVDDFNAMIIELFNSVSGNTFAQGQRVAWNLWTNEPEIVDTIDHGGSTLMTNQCRSYYFAGSHHQTITNGMGCHWELLLSF